MKICLARREIYKQQIRGLLVTNKKLNNITLGREIGLHRNTVAKLLEEIRQENEYKIRERWQELLNELLESSRMRKMQLESLWSDSYSSYYNRPSQMVDIVKAYWKISKDVYTLQLGFLGINVDPKALIQINLHN
ncbi:hypothetical protein HY029_05890 [Candidatus Gottesmanbacteria bacterium]|nr:hypothetical protein [Candidatus Gottesmanbacteria bacterium]